MFSHRHDRDFDAVLEAEEPFALVRYGDGEASLITKKPYVSADQWRTDASRGESWITPFLIESMEFVDDRYCVGIPMACCLAKYVTLANRIQTPESRLTFATIFLHANLSRIDELFHRYDAIVVGQHGGIEVPKDGVSSPWDLDSVVEELLGIDRPIFVAAGPCAKVIIHRYWTRQDPSRRQTIIDVGSAVDAFYGQNTRHYHDKNSFLRDHRCTWTMRGAAPQPEAAKTQERPVQNANRIRVGRPGGTSTIPQRSTVTVREPQSATTSPETPCPTCPKGAKIRG